ncbi:hypothetical protein ACFSM5_05265 [Lacibacterium aquatile]|uniref:DUF1579 domain-containing protein n=1 Tax=Lacibacterium aquatile TaxID=1168082 RepID=A0ABW5DMB7_9PROT
MKAVLVLLICAFAPAAGAMSPPNPPEITCWSDRACELEAVSKRRPVLEAEFTALPDLTEMFRVLAGAWAINKEYAPVSPSGVRFDWRVFEDLRWDHYATGSKVKTLAWNEQTASGDREVMLQAFSPSDLLLVTRTHAKGADEDFYMLGGLLRITEGPVPLEVTVRADKKPLEQSARFALRTVRSEKTSGELHGEETLKLCCYRLTLPA